MQDKMEDGSAATPAIELIGLKKTYKATRKAPAKTALHGIDLTIPRGSIFGLLGPNGAGKSTLLSLIARLIKHQSGAIRVDDLIIVTCA